jgi:hypothetical protein
MIGRIAGQQQANGSGSASLIDQACVRQAGLFVRDFITAS